MISHLRECRTPNIEAPTTTMGQNTAPGVREFLLRLAAAPRGEGPRAQASAGTKATECSEG